MSWVYFIDVLRAPVVLLALRVALLLGVTSKAVELPLPVQKLWWRNDVAQTL